VIQLVASTPYQVGEPSQVLIKFLRNENKPKMSHYQQPHAAADIEHLDKTNSRTATRSSELLYKNIKGRKWSSYNYSFLKR
jgi:hypothetical protein